MSTNTNTGWPEGKKAIRVEVELSPREAAALRGELYEAQFLVTRHRNRAYRKLADAALDQYQAGGESDG